MTKAKKSQPIYLQEKNIIVQGINGKNDVNGNPNRIFRVYDKKMSYLGWIDDGYSGRNFQMGRKVKELTTIYASPRQYKDGQEFWNRATYESLIDMEKRDYRASINKADQIIAKEGYYWNLYKDSPNPEERAKEAMGQAKFHKQRAKELRAKLKALKTNNG